jgi:hypothetical protein
MNFMQTLARGAVVILFISSALFAQTVTGSITAVVTDRTAADFPGDEVNAGPPFLQR